MENRLTDEYKEIKDSNAEDGKELTAEELNGVTAGSAVINFPFRAPYVEPGKNVPTSDKLPL